MEDNRFLDRDFNDTSFFAAGLVDGKNQKNRLELPWGVLGKRPA